MVYFFSLELQVPCILWMLVTVNASNPLAYKGQLPELPVIKQFLQQYVHPYLRLLQGLEAPVFRTNKESEMSQFIRERLKEWKPYLQDDDAKEEPMGLDSDDRLTLEGEDETTIVEFPFEIKNSLRNANDTSESYQAIQRYKLLRNKIKTVLDTEAVSHKTKKLVTNTLDEMIAHMIGNQCNWKNGVVKSRQNSKLKNRVDPLVMARTWNTEWQKLKLQYLHTVRSKKEEANPLFRQFQHLISNITNDIKSLSKDYRIECQFIVDNGRKQKKLYNTDDFDQSKTETDKKMLRDKHKLKKLNAKDSSCDNFQLCSDELAVHLNDFYVNLNETVVTTINNYAAMYSRDVVDDDEKDTAVSLVLDTGKKVQDIVKESFKKHTKKFKPAKDKNKDSNIKALKEYIKRTTKSTRKRVKKILVLNLKPLKTRLTETILKDIIVNLDVELGNLEGDLSSKFCTIFEICNGRYISRRQEGGKLIGDKNSVYVKVHLSLDDNLNDTLNVGKMFRRNNPMEVQQQNTAYNRFMRFTKTTIVSINVTRTTLSDITKTTLSDTVTEKNPDTSPSMKVNEIDSNFIDKTKT